MRDITKLYPTLQTKIAELKRECKKQGLKIGIGECLRTTAEQDALYAQGRTKPGEIVTNAKGSTYQSLHQWGTAFDFYRNDGKGAYSDSDNFFEKVGKIGKKLGLKWGGDFKSITDKPHFELSDFTVTKLKKEYKTPEKFFKSWGDKEMTASEKKEFEKLEKRVAELEKVYHYTNELPEWARPTIQKLLDNGIYKGESESDLNLPEGVMRVLVINDRAGLYDKEKNA